MKVEVTRRFIDLKDGKKIREVGEVIEVNKDRFEQLNKLGFAIKKEEKNG